MATNPLIALQTQSVDTATPLRNLHTQLQQNRQSERQEEILDLRKEQLDLERVRTAFEQQEAADKRRFRNTAVASAQLKRVLESDGPDAAMEWLQNNREGNERLNLPSEDTQEAMQLLESGKVDQLQTHLDNNIFIGESLGLIETPDQPDQWEPITDNEGNPIAQRNTQTGKVVSDPRSPDESKGFTARNIILPDGKKVSGRTTPEGQIEIVNERGEFEKAPQGSQIISTSLQGSESDIGATKPEIRNFRELEANMPVVERLQERIAEGLEADEFVGGVSGSTVRVFNSLRSQVSQLYNTFNEDKPADQRDAELSVDKYQDLFEDVTNVTTKVKSGILDLAYMTLKAKGEKRVSDQDIRLELQTFGLDTNDPEVIMNRVNEKVGDLHANYRTTAKGLGIEPQFDFQERALSSGVPEFSSEEDAQKAIREGDLSVGDEVIVNGKRFKVAE